MVPDFLGSAWERAWGCEAHGLQSSLSVKGRMELRGAKRRPHPTSKLLTNLGKHAVFPYDVIALAYVRYVRTACISVS